MRLFLLAMLVFALIGGVHPAYAEATISVTLQAAPQTSNAGDSVEFKGTGFNPRERVGFWATAPDGAVLGGRYVRSNGNGEISFDFSVPADALNGGWAMTAFGKDSETPAVATFAVVGRPVQSAGLIAAVHPVSGPAGTSFNFVATGFGTRETVSYWFTGPDGMVYDPHEQEIAATNEGRVDISWVPPTSMPKGRWVVTIQGILSTLSRGIVFEVT
jgi:hypothetical protein